MYSAIISIVLPVYNSAEFLPTCIESITSQTHTDWELLIIDDGSTDISGKICDRYAAADPRIRVIHKPNSGVSDSRNLGIAQARGLWITFVDSDDSLKPAYLSDLFDAATKHDADMVAAGWYTQSETILPENHVLDSSDFNYMFFSGINFGYVWGKLFRKTFLDEHAIRFAPGVRWAEDSLFVDCAIMNAKIIVTIASDSYFYNVREGSAVTRLYSFEDELRGYREALRVLPGLDRFYRIKRNNSAFGFLWRTVRALYNECPDRGKRIRTLESLDIDRSRLWHKPTHYKEWILTSMLKHKYFRLFDMAMSRL